MVPECSTEFGFNMLGIKKRGFSQEAETIFNRVNLEKEGDSPAKCITFYIVHE